MILHTMMSFQIAYTYLTARNLNPRLDVYKPYYIGIRPDHILMAAQTSQVTVKAICLPSIVNYKKNSTEIVKKTRNDYNNCSVFLIFLFM